MTSSISRQNENMKWVRIAQRYQVRNEK